MIKDGETYVVTSDTFFYGSDGNQYGAAYGKCKVLKTEDALGFTPQRPSTNWFLQVGEGDRQVILAGCQIHFAVKCDTPPTPRKGTYKKDGQEWLKNQIWFTDAEPDLAQNYGIPLPRRAPTT